MVRLINVRTYEFKDVYDETRIKYAILSHRWGSDELTYEDMPITDEVKLRKPQSWHKLKGTCDLAIRDGLDFVWIDTWCIDKKSSADLSEAINAMFRWYSNAAVCYAFLGDVDGSTWQTADEIDISTSEWFERGWTLQELLAPEILVFYDKTWSRLETRDVLSKQISERTMIRPQFLKQSFAKLDYGNRPVIAEIMSWANGRKTSRGEDRSYSLMGLFNVNMAMLYGEGAYKAFQRLQEEILRDSEDQSILAWQDVDPGYIGPLACSPDQFKPFHNVELETCRTVFRCQAHSKTNEGLTTEFQLIPAEKPFQYYAVLNSPYECSDMSNYAILLGQVDSSGTRFARIPEPFSGEMRWDLVTSSFHAPHKIITLVSRVHQDEKRCFRHDGSYSHIVWQNDPDDPRFLECYENVTIRQGRLLKPMQWQLDLEGQLILQKTGGFLPFTHIIICFDIEWGPRIHLVHGKVEKQKAKQDYRNRATKLDEDITLPRLALHTDSCVRKELYLSNCDRTVTHSYCTTYTANARGRWEYDMFVELEVRCTDQEERIINFSLQRQCDNHQVPGPWEFMACFS